MPLGYAAEGNNDPIIPEEMFNHVQEERNRRSNVEVGADGVKRIKSTKYSAKAKEQTNTTNSKCLGRASDTLLFCLKPCYFS